MSFAPLLLPSSSLARLPGGAGRRIRAGLSLLALLVLAACGPGVGGTGTGVENAQTDTGTGASSPAPATAAADVCDSALAPWLACTASTDLGTAPVDFTEATGATPPLRLHLDGQGLAVSVPCVGGQFRGTWTANAEGSGRWTGTWTARTGATPGTAWATLTPASPGAGAGTPLVLQIQTATGIDDLAPVAVQAGTGTLPAPGCPL